MHEKYERLKEYFISLERVAVAFSGGVDSTFLLYAAHEAIGDRVTALTATSYLFPAREFEEAKQYCESIGVKQIVVRPEPLSIEGFKDNPPDRCYRCKRELFSRFLKAAEEANAGVVVEGSNTDDAGDYRPGLRAIAELSVKSPLRDIGFSKSEIRALSKELGIPTWDKPSFACLASRIPYGETIDKQKLGMVEKAEEYLQGLGFCQMRVRVHGDMARIELMPEDFSRLADQEMRDQIHSKFNEIGFSYVSLDLKGYRTGSMNETINPDNRAMTPCINNATDAGSIDHKKSMSIQETLSYIDKLKGIDDVRASEIRKEAQRSIIKKYRKDIWSRFTEAINKYKLILPGDKIAVCVSGGKDSFLMAKLFQELYEHGERNFEPVYLTMDPGYNEINHRMVTENAKLLGVELIGFKSSIFDIVGENEKSPCYPCARMRRGALYAKAKELGCNKIALGHHYDDVIETILMGMLYGGQFQTMMPKLHSVNFPGMELIRPMYLIREESIKTWAKHNGLHFIQCACRLTEREGVLNGTDSAGKRAETKALIKRLHEMNSYTEANIFKSVENVNLATIVAYKKDGVTHHFLEGYDDM